MRSVEATLYYPGAMSERPVFHAVDPSRTNLVLSPHTGAPPRASIEARAFAFFEH